MDFDLLEFVVSVTSRHGIRINRGAGWTRPTTVDVVSSSPAFDPTLKIDRG